MTGTYVTNSYWESQVLCTGLIEHNKMYLRNVQEINLNRNVLMSDILI